MKSIVLAIFLFCSMHSFVFALDVTLSGTPYTLASQGERFVSSADMQVKAVGTNTYWNWIVDRNLPATPTYTVGSYTEDMAQYALMYMINPVTYADEGAAARLMLLNIGSHFDTSNGSDNEDYGSISARDIAYTWDWIYPLLSSGDKATILAWLEGSFDDMLDRHSYTTWNLRLTKMMGYFMLGLAIYEDSTEAQQWVQDAWTEWKTEVEPYLLSHGINGHNFSGSSYGYARVAPYSFAIYQTLESALGLDQWIDTDQTLRYFMLQLAPNAASLGSGSLQKFYAEGNSGNGNPILNLRTATAYFHALSRATGTLKAQGYDFLNDVMQLNSVSGSLYFRDAFMWLDSRETAGDYTSLPTAMFADGTDIIMSKSDWTASASWAGFTATDFVITADGDSDHQSKNSGSYKFYRINPLIVEGGGASYVSWDVEDSNNIFLDDGYVRDEAWGSVRYSGSWGYNNAAQADIDRYNIDNGYTYARGNLTALYVDGSYMKKADSHYRSILHIGDYLVVADNITTTSLAGSVNGVDNGSQVVKRNQVHYAGTPTISGDQITYTGSSSRVITEVLLPATSTINTTSLTYSDRVNITNTTLQQHDKFLLVHKVGNTSETLTTSLISGTGGQGALFDNTAVMFTSSTSNADIQSLTYTTDATTHYIADLPVNTDISVTRSGTEIVTDQNSGSAGIVKFTAISGNAAYVVTAGDYVPPTETCSDGIQNQDETGIDCGGVCPACPVGGIIVLPPDLHPLIED